MTNIGLKKSVKYLLENVLQIKAIKKGTIGGISIEIETTNPPAYDSYLYRDKMIRDEDFEEIIELTNKKREEYEN